MQPSEQELVEQLLAGRARIESELAKVIVGQKAIIEQILIALFAGGHCLITGAPGLAKTLLVKSIAQIFHLQFQRIQFTPDLMPADITGVEIVDTRTADYLIKVVRASRLLGTRCVLTGLSPAVAQTLVEIGADLSEITTLRSLREGLRHCLAAIRDDLETE